MIPERSAAYVLAVVCIFQALRPSRMIHPQGWRSVDIRIGRLRLRATNYAASVCFEGLTGEKEEEICSSEKSICIKKFKKADAEKAVESLRAEINARQEVFGGTTFSEFRVTATKTSCE